MYLYATRKCRVVRGARNEFIPRAACASNSSCSPSAKTNKRVNEEESKRACTTHSFGLRSVLVLKNNGAYINRCVLALKNSGACVFCQCVFYQRGGSAIRLAAKTTPWAACFVDLVHLVSEACRTAAAAVGGGCVVLCRSSVVSVTRYWPFRRRW